MCGILTILDIKGNHKALRERALMLAKRLRHRGPDWSGIYSDKNAILAHERLAIVDIEHGAQPLYNKKTGAVLAVNGEIYNHKALEGLLKKKHNFQTASDCEVILYLYEEYGADFVKLLNGIFAFVLYDPKNNNFVIGRDHMGIIPLYMGWDKEENIYVASEMKAIVDVCPKIKEFPPGHVYSSEMKKMKRYYDPSWAKLGSYPKGNYDPASLRESLESAVERQLMSDVPYGLLISGGLDSSVISALAAKYKTKRIETDCKKEAWWPQLHSFSIGLKGAPDTEAARKVAKHIGTVHHEIEFALQEGLDALSDVIYHLETFDVTTVRASTPMYLMARKIKAMGIKMVLSGEGADEIFGGYLYFHKAPNAKEFHDETVRKLFKLHQYDCLRANKSTAAWGLEARVPFLDKEFLDMAMSINPEEKMITNKRMEKYILRDAFEGYVPDEILWRQKEQFSDGVGYGWIDKLKDVAEQEISDALLEDAKKRFPIKTPRTKEEYYYRNIFERHFSSKAALECIPFEESIACSTGVAIKWDESFRNNLDPSGLAVKNIHKKL